MFVTEAGNEVDERSNQKTLAPSPAHGLSF